ncbi:CD40 ligand-like [Babylonia areolata]|uniref:CD40 ligand-like n=1 Tax=Babylonia areolata TaxID=304850 RepID=UPI003FCF8535
MSGSERVRMMSQTSSLSSDSSVIDPSENAYAIVQVDSDVNLLSRIKGDDAVHRRGENSSSRSCSIAVVSLCLSVVCLLAVAALFALTFYGTDGSAVSDQERVCVPCGHINPNPMVDGESPLLQQLEVYPASDDGGEDKCCASTPAQFAALFKLIIQRQEEVKNLADILDNENSDNDATDVAMGGKSVSAHLLAKPNSQAMDEQGRSMQRWKSPAESPVSHVRGGLTFHDNKLYVREAGIYFVYCQILYNRPEGPHQEEDSSASPQLASHYVKRYSLVYPSASGLLLKARHTRASGRDDRHSSYVGGLFFLHAGDQLYVQVSVPDLVSNDDRASFFGLFKVGN